MGGQGRQSENELQDVHIRSKQIQKPGDTWVHSLTGDPVATSRNPRCSRQWRLPGSTLLVDLLGSHTAFRRATKSDQAEAGADSGMFWACIEYSGFVPIS